MCAKRGGSAPKRAVELDVLRRIRKVIFAPDDVGDFHLEVVDHVDEMKNPRAIGPPDRHVRVCLGIRQVKIDLSADDIIDHDMFARGAKTNRAVLFKKMAVGFQFP